MSGVNLAVYASSWKDEKDLADIFVYWNQYGYGRSVHGKEMPESLTGSLKTVDITFNKAYTDEYDLFGCCGSTKPIQTNTTCLAVAVISERMEE